MCKSLNRNDFASDVWLGSKGRAITVPSVELTPKNNHDNNNKSKEEDDDDNDLS